MSRAQGQFTIIDYNDALTLTGFIGSNLAKTQMYNPDNGSYSPDWTSTMNCWRFHSPRLVVPVRSSPFFARVPLILNVSMALFQSFCSEVL